MIIVVRANEDGDHLMESMPEDVFVQRLNEQYWGEHPEFATAVPRDLDAFVGLVVIRGSVVVPVPVEKVTQYRLPEAP